MNRILVALGRGATAVADAPLTAEALHRRHLAEVFAYVSRRLPHRADAEDLTADVFAAAFARLDRLRPGDDPKPWLLAIARNKLIDRARRRKTRPETPDPEALESVVSSEATPEATAVARERRQELWRLVDALPADQREALLLQHVDDLSHAEIAVVLKKSPAAVNSLLQRARATLSARGASYFLDPENSR